MAITPEVASRPRIGTAKAKFTIARMVAAIIARKPPAIHCAALTARAVPDVSADRSWISPASTAAAVYAIAGAGMIR